MSRIAYVNGRYVPFADARVHIEDRGYQFADGVYEVCAVRGANLVDEAPHLARLDRSLREMQIRPPVASAALAHIMRETIRRNAVGDGLVYVQVTRGVARRDHAFPATAKPSLVVTARNLPIEKYEAWAASGVEVKTMPETRWARCDIKSVALLANVLAKQNAREAGAYEAWFVDDDGHVTEGASTTAWIVDAAGVLRTRKLGNDILPGVTRGELLPMCRQLGIQVAERAFTVAEAKAAREAFITAASIGVISVVKLDGSAVGEGLPGPVAKRLRAAYWADRV
jgi:D-alanine transaminase